MGQPLSKGAIQTRRAVVMETPPTKTSASEPTVVIGVARSEEESKARPEGWSGRAAGITQPPTGLHPPAPATFTARTRKAIREAGCRSCNSK